MILVLLELREGVKKKSRIRETPTLSTDADSRTDTNLKRVIDFFFFFFFFFFPQIGKAPSRTPFHDPPLVSRFSLEKKKQLKQNTISYDTTTRYTASTVKH